ncbi:class I SAM-dependent methyltransferase [Candidatus Dependentiae bacterium]|nr:class I SAM-dependent methyltransferase [Candidatus Dependentiae bacterium]
MPLTEHHHNFSFYCNDESYSVLHCKKCGLKKTAVYKIAEKKNINLNHNIYHDYRYYFDGLENKISNDIYNIFNSLIPLIKKEKINIFDIGCGNGEFLKRIQNTPFVSKIGGIDISADMVFKAKINSKGLFIVGNLNELKFKTEKSDFNVITLWDVIEHVENPDNMINNVIKNILEKDGYVIIKTINDNGICHQLLKFLYILTKNKKYIKYIYNQSHNTLYNKYNIRQFFLNKGFKLVKCKYYDIYFLRHLPPDMYFLKKIFFLIIRIMGIVFFMRQELIMIFKFEKNI